MYRPTTALQKIAKLQKPIRIIQGSQGAGKTISIEMLLQNHGMHQANCEITIIQAELSKLKKTAMRDFQKILRSYDMWDVNRWNKTESIYTLPNGTYFEFIGLDKADVGKGFRRDVVFFNEVNKGNISLDTFIQFSSRSKVTYADFNPDKNFWIHDEIIPDKDTDFLILTYLDNEYLPQSEIKSILKYREKGFYIWEGLTLKELFDEGNIKSKYWSNKWRVYGLGLVGFLDGVVFENWMYGEFNPDKLQTSCGMDFGFSVDPDTLTEVAIDKAKKKIYLKSHIYRTGLKTNDLADLIKAKVGYKLIISEVDPRLVADLQHRGCNVLQHKKGKIETGVTMMLDYEIIVDTDSKDLGKEFANYSYADKGTNLYIDDFNHGIDGARYNIEHHLENPDKGNYYIY